MVYFLCTSSAPLAPNAGAHLLPEAGATQVGRIRARCLTARFPNPPVRTVHATFTAHGSRERDIYGDVHFARIPPHPWCTACAFPGYLCTVSLPYPSGPSPCIWLSHIPTTMPHLTAWRASELSVRVSPAYFPTLLDIPCRLSRVRHGGLNQDGLGGTFLVAPSTLCGSPVPGESNQVLLSHLLQHRS